MSRALNVNATEAEVRSCAAAKGAAISAIEAILSGGTRVVFANGADAEVMRGVFVNRMIEGAVTRERWVSGG
ncbi:hypothetical protein ASE95_16530 [Sphingomonas sp. Leaf231]|nr:hypothetical protein ASE95_16530 [Sphingomonas sp. Leaf231]